jgi:hypothetical protein
LRSTGIFASWHWTIALAVSSYLMKASTELAMYAVPGIAGTTASVLDGI